MGTVEIHKAKDTPAGWLLPFPLNQEAWTAVPAVRARRRKDTLMIVVRCENERKKSEKAVVVHWEVVWTGPYSATHQGGSDELPSDAGRVTR